MFRSGRKGVLIMIFYKIINFMRGVYEKKNVRMKKLFLFNRIN